MKTFVKDSTGEWIEKDPDAKKDYSNDWADWLAQSSGDTIAASSWIVDVGLTKETSPPEAFVATGLCTVWLSGGTLGKTYKVTNRITTTGGRTEDSTFLIKIVAQ